MNANGNSLPAKTGPGAVDELRDRRHLERRQHEQDGDAQEHDGADLHERRQVVARRQQQPHRQHRRDEPVDHDRPGEAGARPGEGRSPGRALRHPLAAEERAATAGTGRCPVASPTWPGRSTRIHQPMSSAIGMVRRQREEAPRAVAQRVHDDQRQHRQQDDHDREDGDHAGHARHLVHFLLRDLAERLAVAPHRRAQDHEVLHRAAEHDADDQPERARQEAELRRQRRPDQRSRRRRWPRSGGRRAPTSTSARSRGRCSAARPAWRAADRARRRSAAMNRE